MKNFTFEIAILSAVFLLIAVVCAKYGVSLVLIIVILIASCYSGAVSVTATHIRSSGFENQKVK